MGKKTLLLTCTFLLCIFLARAGTVDAAISTVAVNPPSLTVLQPNQSFTVIINITNAPTMTQYLLNITWDPDVLELETGTEADVVEGPFLKSFGSTIFLVKTPEPDRLPEVTCGLLYGYANGDGDLFTIKFRSKAVGVSDINIAYCVLFNELVVADIPNLQKGTVTVLPEFTAFMLLLLLLTTTAFALITKKVWSRKRRIPATIP